MSTESITISVATELCDLITAEAEGNKSKLFVQGVKRQIVWKKNYGAVREIFLTLTREEDTGETEPVTFNCPIWLKRRLERHMDHLVMSLDGFMANSITKYLVNKEFDNNNPLSPLAEELIRRFENETTREFEGILP